jgi:hypothetical protein
LRQSDEERRLGKNRREREYRLRHRERIRRTEASPEHRAKDREAARRRRKNDPEPARKADRARYDRSVKNEFSKWRVAHLKKLYGMTPEAFLSLVALQEGRCAICRLVFEDCTAVRRGVRMRASVDHKHGTFRVRGLLCGNCNLGIGNFRDDTRLLIRAIKYLRRSEDDLRRHA